ncbi:hypothetical protein ACFQX6_10765 [Streptosporangium lutulentum]
MAAIVPGKQLEPVKSAPAPVDMRRAFRRIKNRQRGKLAFVRPVAWLAAIQTTGVIAHETGLGLMVAAPTITVVTATIAVRAKRRGAKARLARPASGSLWLLIAVFAGPYGLIAFVLWIVGLGGAVNYWFAAYQGLTRSNRKALPKMDMPKTDALAGLPRWYAETVVPANPAFTGTSLTDAEQVPGGFTGVIVGVPGKTQTGNIEKQIGVLASARGVPLDQVEVGPPPGRSYSGARITIIERGDNLRQVRYLEDEGAAIDLKTGIARVGNFFDLKPTRWAFWTTLTGAQMGINSGSTGGGKSGFGGSKLALVHQCPSPWRCCSTTRTAAHSRRGTAEPRSAVRVWRRAGRSCRRSTTSWIAAPTTSRTSRGSTITGESGTARTSSCPVTRIWAGSS